MLTLYRADFVGTNFKRGRVCFKMGPELAGAELPKVRDVYTGLDISKVKGQGRLIVNKQKKLLQSKTWK